ncbi:MAG: CBS domain-containing protein [Magnetococcales bacterium]|nr:CBS domain-containing protein [Magnetococcales bacterium]NGZ26050.1 CBS domain-containing protein [Magnetococcales bacterium]
MNIHNRKEFIHAIRPFDRISNEEMERVVAALDIQFFPEGKLLMKAGDSPEVLHILFKGAVREEETESVLAYHGPGDAFDAGSLISGICRHDFVVAEEVICYTLHRSIFLELARGNRAFQDYYFQNLSQKVEELREISGYRDFNFLVTAHVKNIDLHPALMIDGQESIQQAALLMKDRKVHALLVKMGGERTGLVEDVNIRDAVAGEGIDPKSPVASIAQRNPVVADGNDYLFDALLTMTRHQVNRLLVKQANGPEGFLELADLLGYWSNQSHLVGARIERAENLQQLREAAERIPFAIQTLFLKGVKVRFVARMMRELNRRLLAKLFSILAPPELIANSVLVVMGSEGRGEQLVKTDQDNALILRDGFSYPQLNEFRKNFAEAMHLLNIPPCPGKLMLSEEGWCGSLKFFIDTLNHWIQEADAASLMNLAILYDASPSAGDTRILLQLKRNLYNSLPDNLPFFSRFAQPSVAFDTPLSLFSQFVVEKRGTSETLDVKKGGIFPIVHGVRSLALEKHLKEVNTIKRIYALAHVGVFDHTFAEDLSEAFDFISGIRFRAMLAKGATCTDDTSLIDPSQYSNRERELLKESFRTVDRLKKLVVQHFRLNLLG